MNPPQTEAVRLLIREIEKRRLAVSTQRTYARGWQQIVRWVLKKYPTLVDQDGKLAPTQVNADLFKEFLLEKQNSGNGIHSLEAPPFSIPSPSASSSPLPPPFPFLLICFSSLLNTN